MGNQKSEGTVKFFKRDKGFGFIIDDNSGKDIFFHISGLSEIKDKGKITADDRVEFSLREGKRGQEACEIVIL
jgi:CspA family cold shock protein